MKRNPKTINATICVAILACVLGNANLQAGTVDSFTEPYRQVAVPASEVGVLAVIAVTEGEKVTKGQKLANLDDRILQASLEVTRAAMKATGALQAAEADNKSAQKKVDSYKELINQGNASQREYDRAVNDQLQSAARLQSAREEQEVRRLEYERSKIQVMQRQVISPIDGFVVSIEKEAGEFVSPNDPVVMNVVDLETLKAVFSIPRKAAAEVQLGQEIDLKVGYEDVSCTGVVEFISPTADPQSGSVRIKVRIANPENKLPSGAACRWDLDSYDDEPRISLGDTLFRSE